MKLASARIHKYKSIEDSTNVDFNEQVTVLVGKNESGKSAFLEALHKALPLGKANFDFVYDYPRKDYIRDRSKFDAKALPRVTELTFRLDDDLVNEINRDVFQSAQVIPMGLTFTRSTTFNNTNTVGLSIDQVKALDVYRQHLKDIEHVDEVFRGSTQLENVIVAIEELKLEPDHRLSVFAKLWRDRNKDASPNWDLLGWHIWNKYLSVHLPRFLYFDDYRLLTGKINLDSLQQRIANSQTTSSDDTALGLFELAGITLSELSGDEGYENSKAKLEAIGLTITQEIFEFWKQNKDLAVEFDIRPDPKDQPPFNVGKNLYIRIKNLRHGVTVPFDQRSKGFIWFFSFLAWFSSIQNRVNTKKDLILLLDEPGLNLHALAQADFLHYIGKLSEDNQIIFTTHSPFMVPSDSLDRVRVVEDRLKEGTKVSSQLEGSADESLFPLQAALGYSIAQNLFISKKNILIEGPADLILLTHMSSLLDALHLGPLDEGILVPVGGLDKLATFVALLGATRLRLVVLHDKSTLPNQKLDELVHQKLIERKRILDYSMFRPIVAKEADVEDLFPVGLYVDAFNLAYKSELGGKSVSVSALPAHPRVVERMNAWLKLNNLSFVKDGGFNHYRVAQALLPLLTATTLQSADLAVFEKLFHAVNSALK